jgi:acetylornithine deacetylase/succinyl-diaminopimelate desuccinylase-like protein
MTAASAVGEVLSLAHDLIRIDSTNTGDPDTLIGKRQAAEYVAAQLEDVGYETTYLEAGAPGRGNVIARLAPTNPALADEMRRVHPDGAGHSDPSPP